MCGIRSSIPPALAGTILKHARLVLEWKVPFIRSSTRDGTHMPPVALAASAGVGEKLAQSLVDRMPRRSGMSHRIGCTLDRGPPRRAANSLCRGAPHRSPDKHADVLRTPGTHSQCRDIDPTAQFIAAIITTVRQRHAETRLGHWSAAGAVVNWWSIPSPLTHAIGEQCAAASCGEV